MFGSAAHPRGARVLELGEGPHQRQLLADAAVDVAERRQAEALPHGVEVLSAALQSVLNRARGAPPEGAAKRGAWQAGADRVDRGARWRVGVHVGDERRDGYFLELGGERGGEREDVGDHDLRLELTHERERVAGGVHDRLVEVERLRPVREDVVLGGARRSACPPPPRARASAPTSAASPRARAPPARARGRSSGRRGPGRRRRRGGSVVGLATSRARRVSSSAAPCCRGAPYAAASSATRRSCVRRSSAVNASGVIPSVPTPASR